MKNLFFLSVFCLAGFAGSAQFVYKIKADSVKITNDSCTAELILENSTRNVKGFLYNKGNGRTEFRSGLILANDTLVSGGDSILLGANFWKLLGNSGTNPSQHFLGTKDNTALVFRTNNVERMRIRNAGNGQDGFVGIGTNNPTSIMHLKGLNPMITIEGDSNSYYQGIILKSPPYIYPGAIDPYGIYGSHAGGLHAISNTANGRVEIAATYTGAKSMSTDSTLITHQVIGAKGQTAALLDVAANVSVVNGNAVASSLFTVKNNGALFTAKYKNNAGEDSVLSTDVNGNVKLKSWSSGVSSNAWSLVGNTGISTSTNFLGTTDNHPIIFKTNNVERLRILGIGSGMDGFVGIGTSGPSKLLNLYGTNPTILIEGDSNSYTPAIWFKSPVYPIIGKIDPYGVYASNTGGVRLWTTTPNGRAEIGVTPTGVKSLSRDSTAVAHQVIGARNQTADLFDVAENIATLDGYSVPGSLFTVKNTGKLKLARYLNSAGEDSVLTTDVSGNVKLKAWSAGVSGSAWTLTGNTGTNPTSNFLGTTDSKRLVFRTNNVERATIDSIGRVGIGTSTPADLLTVSRSDAGIATSINVISASTQGATFNTTSGALNSYGGYFNNNGTRASGSNNLTNVGLYTTASGGQVNYALKTDGSVNMVNLGTTTDTSSYKPLGINSSGDLAKVTGWPPVINYTVQSLSDAGGTITWNVANGINAMVTLTGTGRTLSITNPVAGQTYTIRIIQDGIGSRTITTWPTSSKWPSGTTPTLSTVTNRYDIVVLYYDGTNYYGTYQQNFQ